jgi:hypothetical protein
LTASKGRGSSAVHTFDQRLAHSLQRDVALLLTPN